MSKQPLGKTLLRNVIRHTDAHNKIQEEMEMWKMRDWEIQTSDHKHLPNTDIMRGHMHCDRVPNQSGNMSAGRERVSEHDDREARYWTRRLYEFEASDPDRWGHSGFKELYPEEFDSGSDKSVTIKKTRHRKIKKSKSDTEACLSKRSKKSSHKKKKKKKKAEDGKRKKDKSSSNDSGTDDRSDIKDKQGKKKRTKSRHKNKKSVKTQRRDEDSSSGESNSEGKRERRTNGRKKRKRDSLKDSDSELDSNKKRRKNWKAAGEESSDDSSTD